MMSYLRAIGRGSITTTTSSCVSVCGRPGRRVHALSHDHPGVPGEHEGEAEARRPGLGQRHGHPNPNASWWV